MLASDDAGEALRTKRLVLVPLAPEHAPALHRLQNDWQVVRMLAKVPWPLAVADIAAFAQGQRSEARESDDFVILLEGQPVGACGVKRPGFGEPPRIMPRFGYWIGRPHWGKGYAGEALAALVARAFRAFPHDLVGAGVFHDNLASRRVLDRLGFVEARRYETPCVSRGTPVLTIDMHLSRRNWEGG
jgi:8-oxo-dGTP diphosphatase